MSLVCRVTLAIVLPSLLLLAAAAAEPARDPAASENGAEAPAAAAPAPRLQFLVPAYFYPAGPGVADWERLTKAAAAARIVAIVNPASGPGERVDPTYTRVFDDAAAKGVTLIGYVTTSYAKRPRADVEAEVERWVKFYPQVKGIFFDEQVSAADPVDDFYKPLFAHARRTIKDALVVSNPGVPCDEAYVTRAEAGVLCIWEHGKGIGEMPPPAWLARHPRDRFALLPYNIPTAEGMREHLATAADRGIGFVYVTDNAARNPWDRLPTYWEAEVEAVRKLNEAATK